MSEEVNKFAAHHGTDANEVFHGAGLQSKRLQNELSHWNHGWEARTENAATVEQATAMAHEAYRKMSSWNSSMRTIDRDEYVAGYVASAGF